MPTYEYACRGCGHEWEASQSIKDDPLRDCPSCGEAQAKRQISAGTGFILKGGGWYSDLYSSSDKKGADAPGTGSNTEADASSHSSKADKSETKPAADPKPAKESKADSGTS